MTYDRAAMLAAYTSSSDRSTARAAAAVQEQDHDLVDLDAAPSTVHFPIRLLPLENS